MRKVLQDFQAFVSVSSQSIKGWVEQLDVKKTVFEPRYFALENDDFDRLTAEIRVGQPTDRDGSGISQPAALDSFRGRRKPSLNRSTSEKSQVLMSLSVNRAVSPSLAPPRRSLVRSPSRPSTPQQRRQMESEILSAEGKKETSGSTLVGKLQRLDDKSAKLSELIVIRDEPNLLESDVGEPLGLPEDKAPFKMSPALSNIVGRENQGTLEGDPSSNSQNVVSFQSASGKSPVARKPPRNFLQGRAAPQIAPPMLPLGPPPNSDAYKSAPDANYLPRRLPSPNLTLSIIQAYGQMETGPSSPAPAEASRFRLIDLLTKRAAKIYDAKASISNPKLTAQLQKGSKINYCLNLSGLGLRDQDLAVLLQNKKILAGKTDLNLSGNLLTDDGVSILLFRMAESNSKVGQINFSRNKATERSLHLLFKFLRHCKNDLTDVDLTKNGINEPATAGIVDAIQNEGVLLLL